VKKEKNKKQEEIKSSDSFTLLSHRNELQTSLKDCLVRAFQGRSKKEESPSWIRDLVDIKGVDIEPGGTIAVEDDSNKAGVDRSSLPPYQILITGAPTFHRTDKNSSASVKRNFVTLDKEATLLDALRTHTFVEFPTFEVVSDKDAEHIRSGEDDLAEEDEWQLFDRKRRLYEDEEEESDGDDSDGSMSGSGDEEEEDEEDADRAQEARRKRRKIDAEAGKNLINSLMGYADEDSEGENESGNNNAAQGPSKVQPSGATPVPKGLGVLQMLDYESDKSSEEEEEEEDKSAQDKSNDISKNIVLAPVSGWEEREMVDWGDD
jgi:hypothetical protein